MRRWGFPILFSFVALGLIGIAADRALAWHRTSDRVGLGNAAVAAAQREVKILISVSGATSSADLARLRSGATGDFKKELTDQSSTFAQALRASKVTARGTVASAGLASVSARTATVLIAATGTVTNTASKAPAPRSYQLRAEVTRTHGMWLVSKLEFVS